jgi:pimeloyl-ACP methyl ester carboxylesterase
VEQREQTLLVRAADGRRLRVAEWGVPQGSPMVYLHGTPGSRLDRTPDPRVLAEAGVRLITFDRAGYGGSDRRPGRRVRDVVEDVSAVADALGLGRFAVLGQSGGGPHVLACAALLPERVTRAAAIAGPAPPDADGLDWLGGMAPVNVEEFSLAFQGAEPLERALERMAAEIASNPEELFNLLEAQLPESDRAVLRRPEVRTMLRDALVTGLQPGAGGWVDDDLAFTQPWGFDPGAIAVPVSLWHGADDNLAPRSHAAWLAGAIPRAEFHEVAGVAHVGMLDAHPQIYRWLLAGSAA